MGRLGVCAHRRVLPGLGCGILIPPPFQITTMAPRSPRSPASKRAFVSAFEDTVAWRMKCRRMSQLEVDKHCDEESAARILQRIWRGHGSKRAQSSGLAREVVNDVEPFTQEAIQDVQGAMFDVSVAEGRVLRYHAASLFRYLHQSKKLQEPVQRHALSECDVHRLEGLLSDAGASDGERELLHCHGTLLVYTSEEAQRESERDNQIHNDITAVLRDDLEQCLRIMGALLHIRHGTFAAHVRHIDCGAVYDLQSMRNAEEALDSIMGQFQTTCMHFAMWSRSEAAEAMRQKMKDVDRRCPAQTSDLVLSLLAVMERWITACEYPGASPMHSSRAGRMRAAEADGHVGPDAPAEQGGRSEEHLSVLSDDLEHNYQLPRGIMLDFPCIPSLLIVERSPT